MSSVITLKFAFQYIDHKIYEGIVGCCDIHKVDISDRVKARDESDGVGNEWGGDVLVYTCLLVYPLLSLDIHQ